jgi:hypothetical protein
MAEPLEDLDLPPELANLPPEVVVTNLEYFDVPEDEHVRRRRVFFDRIRNAEPTHLPFTAAEVLAEVRRDEGWD